MYDYNSYIIESLEVMGDYMDDLREASDYEADMASMDEELYTDEEMDVMYNYYMAQEDWA